MSDQQQTPPSPQDAGASPDRPTAGQMLRQARQARGLHIAALATSIKVLPRKLEALEADRYEELPDATFTRALAQTVCRTLKIDPAPVLALLPKASGMQLERGGPSNLNTPFRERQGHPGRNDAKAPGGGLPLQFWLPALLVLGAIALYFSPADFHPWRSLQSLWSTDGGGSTEASGEPAPEAGSPSASAGGESGLPVTVQATDAASLQQANPIAATAATAASAGQAAASSATAPTPLLELRVTQDSWIEVQDGAAKSLLSRKVAPQEVVALNGSLPLRVKVGNASKTTVRFRGEVVDLAPMTRDNVARLELK